MGIKEKVTCSIINSQRIYCPMTDPPGSNAKEEKEPQAVLAGLKAAEICSKCGLPHRGKVAICQADVADNTSLLPGRRKDSWNQFEQDEENEDTVRCNIESGISEKLSPEEEKNPSLIDLADLIDIEEQSPEDLVGHTLVNKYALLALIGKGGMSAVYRAKDLKLNKMLAVKLMLPHLASQNINAKRFQIEAQAASSLYHPNLIATHDYGVTDRGMPYIAMDLVDGKSLSEVLKEDGALPIKRAIPIFIQICDALAHAHGKNVLHRDLKPSNVMLTTTGSQFDFVKLVDFGIAKMLPENDNDRAAELTRTGEIFGSPQYMSPEQCTSAALDARSDIYSMGCLLYEVIAGAPPFKSDNVMEILFAQMNESPPGFKQVNTNLEIPQNLQLIIYRCLAKDPEERYQSASELAQELNKFNQKATDIFIRNVQAKWQVFKLKRRPMKRRERKYLLVTLALSLLLAAAAGKLISDYWVDDSLGKLTLKQAFMPTPVPKSTISTDKLVLSRAMESGISKRLERLGPHPDREALGLIASDSEKVARSYMSYGEFDLARKYFQLSIDLLKRFDNTGESNRSYTITFAKIQIGNCFFASGAYSRAIPYYKEGIETLTLFGEGSRDKSYLIETLIYKASAEYAAGEFNDSIKTFKRLLKVIPEADIKPGKEKLALIYSQLADCYRLKGNFNTAIEYYKSAVKNFKASPSLRTTGDTTAYNRYLMASYLQGYCQYRLNNFDEAARLYEQVLPGLKGAEEKRELRTKALAQYADILWQKGSLARSLEISLKARELKRLD